MGAFAITRVRAVACSSCALAAGSLRGGPLAGAGRPYLRQQGASLAIQNDAAELKLRAERRIGELLAETVTRAPRGKNMSQSATCLPADVTRSQSSRWQGVASIPEPDFEAELARQRDDPEALDLLDQATVARPGGDHGNQYTGGKGDNVNLATVAKGNARQYALRRLRRAAPEVHARVLAAQDRAGRDFSGHPGLGSTPCVSSALTTLRAAT